ncbi:hypothetical protein VTN77DRAFT_4863 [Rasamsonia byssochlamydoides]|uniref:uncharacterized protein n=1 Tax=Rasamsonia byssochlamydoides TaxID=89139 RepID=UPI003744A29B
MTADEAVTDVKDAIAAGFDAFALNVASTEAWSTTAISYLFSAANNAASDFKLFFSFDMSQFTNPSQFLPLIEQYASNDSYLLQDGRPFVSTFWGGASSYTFGQDNTNDGWNVSFRQPLLAKGINPFFVPDFDDWSGYPNGFFDTFSVVDGAFSWESAWPEVSGGKVNVSDSIDQTVLQEARAAKKVYMMPLSTFQFKHLSGGGQNWYRIGELNYAERIAQVLALQPDFVEVLTWNDAGESHYVGNFWPEQIAGSDIGTYANGFDHTGWQQVLPSFISAYKSGVTDVSKLAPPSGKAAVGVMWYRTLLTTASCSSDSLGKPSGWQNAQDAINFAVILDNKSSYTINVYSNNKQIGSFPASAGLNGQTVLGLQAGGGQRVEVVDAATNTTVISATGTKDVLAEATGTCNFNYEVVALS